MANEFMNMRRTGIQGSIDNQFTTSFNLVACTTMKKRMNVYALHHVLSITNLISGILWTNIRSSSFFSFFVSMISFGERGQTNQCTYASEDDDNDDHFYIISCALFYVNRHEDDR